MRRLYEAILCSLPQVTCSPTGFGSKDETAISARRAMLDNLPYLTWRSLVEGLIDETA